jgi:hypothetical protein
MNSSLSLVCDGCGLPASPEHLTRRLQRLEWSTRFRPVHIQTLFLGAAAPSSDGEFLYSPSGEFAGEAGDVLRALNIFSEGKPAEAIHIEVQRSGAFLTHVLECPVAADSLSKSEMQELMLKRLGPVAARLRRSLRPKRVVPVSREFEMILSEFLKLDLGCPILLDGRRPFDLGSADTEGIAMRLQVAAKLPQAT